MEAFWGWVGSGNSLCRCIFGGCPDCRHLSIPSHSISTSISASHGKHVSCISVTSYIYEGTISRLPCRPPVRLTAAIYVLTRIHQEGRPSPILPIKRTSCTYIAGLGVSFVEWAYTPSPKWHTINQHYHQWRTNSMAPICGTVKLVTRSYWLDKTLSFDLVNLIRLRGGRNKPFLPA